MTVEEYRDRMIEAFQNADCSNLIALVVLPKEKEFEHLEWLLKTHYKDEQSEDCISRKQAINELKLAYFNKDLQSAKDDPCIVDAMTDWSIRTIKKLPPVTPSYNSINTELKPCEDCISREDALEWVDESLRRYGGTYSTDMLNMWGLFKDWIGKLPSVTPKIGSEE